MSNSEIKYKKKEPLGGEAHSVDSSAENLKETLHLFGCVYSYAMLSDFTALFKITRLVKQYL